MPDTSKLEKLNRELEKSEKKLRKAINDEKALRSPKAPRRKAVICASNEPNEYACIFTRRMPQQPTECWLPHSWSAPNHTGDATPSPLCFGRCRANVHWTFCTPALATASYPFVDLPSGDTLCCKLFPADKFYKISLYFDGRVKYNEVNGKAEVDCEKFYIARRK